MFCVKVPILSEQITLIQPMVSEAIISLTKAFCLDSLMILMERKTATIVGSPYGTAATIKTILVTTDCFVDILDCCFKIRILRVICLTCDKTHAILIQDMVPFSIMSFDYIIPVLIHAYPDIVSSAHFFYLKYKYPNPFKFSYKSFCLRNQRNCSLIFISHDFYILPSFSTVLFLRNT